MGVLSLTLLCLMLAQQSVPATSSTGLKGTTTFRVVGGEAGRAPLDQLMGIEFAIAPIVKGKPAYQRARFVTSSSDGSYAVSLPPGRYWIGPSAKAHDPQHYKQTEAAAVREQVVIVRETGWTHLDIAKIVEAPSRAPIARPNP